VLALLGKGSPRGPQRAYQRYVEEAVREGLQESLVDQVKGQVLLGSQRLWEKLQKKAARGKRREQHRARSLVRRPAFDEVVEVVEELTRKKWKDFCDRHRDP